MRLWPAAGERARSAARIQGRHREPGELARRAFAGLDPVPPGAVLASEWHPGHDGPFPAPAEVSCHGGVGRKP